MEFEALLLGIEPLTALAVGLGAVVLAPVASAVGHAVGDEKLVESFSESARDLTKKTLVLGLAAFENAQGVFAEAQESFRDIVAEAKADQAAKQTNAEHTEPHEVEIVSE